MDCTPLGSSVHETSQVRILEWVAISFPKGSSQLRDQTCVSCIAGGFFTTEPPGKPTTFVHLLLLDNRESKKKGSVRNFHSCFQLPVIQYLLKGFERSTSPCLD